MSRYTPMVTNLTAYSNGTLEFNHRQVRAALGKAGTTTASTKKEGDGKSPIGIWPIRYVFYRPDRLPKPKTALPVIALSPDDGWCDDPARPEYNQHVKLPFPGGHEKLWRDDHVYDLIVVLGHNDGPIIPGAGSAIFMHLARDGYPGTEGCVALDQDNLLDFLKVAEPGSAVEIRE
jgi:L,D-peptidoglycan transpeptidase YkuD (ErfK/YbiS/YcfS/YnhG family)